MTKYDVIVVGGGHAGCEAAAAAARMGVRVGLITFDATTIGAMSCNPAIGGLGKGHLVREVDALDGLIGRAADAAAIHYRMLNRSKGSAVWGPRIQADRKLFRASVQRAIASFANLAVITGEAAALLFEKDRVVGVTLADGSRVNGGAVVLCTGTFLGGVLFRGTERFVGGRFGEASASLLAKQMRDSGLVIGRLKTGTPPRLDGRTINWAALDEQPSDAEPWTMSPLTPHRINPQLRCLITRTNSRSHDIIRANLDASPLFSGDIEGVGPRYCPSIEDKVHRFGDRDGHQIFLEPEGLDTPLVYPNGISTSLPADVQLTLLRSIEGLERVEMVTPGYAVEYDHLDPRALTPGLEVRALPGLFCAGQINGTTGYEEAAAQGLIAGMHAAAACLGAEPAPLDRGNSYLAVMIDDLTLHGVSEPYRMLTARAEYRLRLRANNAATRLTSLGIAAGMVGEERCRWFEHRVRQKEQWLTALQKPAPSRELAERGLPLRRELGTKSLEEWLRYPGITLAELKHWLPPHLEDAGDIAEELTEDALYAPYVARQEGELRELRAGVSLQLGSEFLYEDVAGLSREMVERLSASRPSTLADAGRVRGITPAALAAVMVHAKRRNAA